MFYLVILQNAGLDSAAQSVYAYSDIDDALAMFHSELAYRAAARQSTACVILDGTGSTIKRDAWAVHTETTAEK